MNGGEVVVNIFHGVTITFVNHHVAPPPPICDFITFGRLVTEVNGQKVVISGNAGGNKPGGGILGEFHIEANGVDNHVADIDSYDTGRCALEPDQRAHREGHREERCRGRAAPVGRR